MHSAKKLLCHKAYQFKELSKRERVDPLNSFDNWDAIFHWTNLVTSNGLKIRKRRKESRYTSESPTSENKVLFLAQVDSKLLIRFH